MKTNFTRNLQVLTSVGAVFYLFFVVMVVFHDAYPIFQPFGFFEVLILLFTAAFVLSWTQKKLLTGILFMLWNACVWVGELYLSRSDQDTGMISAMASYFMIIGAFFLLDWYKNSKETVPVQKKQKKFLLRVLLVNYTLLYLIVVFAELSVGEPINYISFPYIIYPFLFLIFIFGFLISWKKELYAAYVFLFWCGVLIFANIVFSEISGLGGWALFGVPILLQGIFYIENHRKQKLEKQL